MKGVICGDETKKGGAVREELSAFWVRQQGAPPLSYTARFQLLGAPLLARTSQRA